MSYNYGLYSTSLQFRRAGDTEKASILHRQLTRKSRTLEAAQFLESGRFARPVNNKQHKNKNKKRKIGILASPFSLRRQAQFEHSRILSSMPL
jgi:hypothetical protein